MIAFPGMLVRPAEEAGMKVPPDPDEFTPTDFPHFYAFCVMQLGRPILNGMTSHWENAKIIASVPEDKILAITPADLFDMGFV